MIKILAFCLTRRLRAARLRRDMLLLAVSIVGPDCIETVRLQTGPTLLLRVAEPLDLSEVSDRA